MELSRNEIICSCGAIVKKTSHYLHLKTQKHIKAQNPKIVVKQGTFIVKFD